jgi:hypothetical protein
MFSDEFLENLPNNPYEAIRSMSECFDKEHQAIPPGEEVENFDKYIDAFAALEAFIQATELPFGLPNLNTPPDPQTDIKIIGNCFKSSGNHAAAKLRERKYTSCFDKSREKYAMRFGTVFAYRFSDGDIARIQQLLNELRDKITDSELFDAKHKERILVKLEKLQTELHKKMSSLDKLWGLIGEAGVVLGKFGQDAKPLADRIREIAQITWRTQARAEELPSGATLPLLSKGEQEDE